MAGAREGFVRLAEARTSKLLKSLDLLGNLSNRSNYSYAEEDVRKIFSALRRRMKEVEDQFKRSGNVRRDVEFKL